MLPTRHHGDERHIRVEEERRIRVEQRLAELRRFHGTAIKRLAETQRAIEQTEAAIRQLEDELKRARSVSLFLARR